MTPLIEGREKEASGKIHPQEGQERIGERGKEEA